MDLLVFRMSVVSLLIFFSQIFHLIFYDRKYIYLGSIEELVRELNRMNLFLE